MSVKISVARLGADEPSDGTCYEYLFDRGEVLIGRSDAVDVCLPDPSVSLVHGQLAIGEDLTYADLDSTNGSRVDGRPSIPREQVIVGVGSRILVGPFELRIVPAGAQVSLTSPGDTASYARQMILDAMRALGQRGECAVEVMSGPGAGQRTSVAADTVLVIGRGEECGLRLDDGDVSRRHAEIVCDADGARVVDLGSKNGLRVDGQQVADARALHDGDQIELGNTLVRFHDPPGELMHRLQGPEPGSAAAGEPAGAEKRPAGGLGAVQSGELRSDGGGVELSPASAFELGTPSSVLPAAQVETPESGDSRVGGGPGRATDVALFVVGAALVLVAAALIAYLVVY